jgi:murein DD-endopeptidase MepM/ murein hydrolase activator NlpD
VRPIASLFAFFHELLRERANRGQFLGFAAALVAAGALTPQAASPASVPLASAAAEARAHTLAESMAFPETIEAPFTWPVFGPITNVMDDSHPLGIDLGLAHSPTAPIVAVAAGRVTFAGGTYCCSYGYHVIIEHEDGLSTLYGHLSEVLVQEGETLAKGQVLGNGGASGYSLNGSHLHFEVRRGSGESENIEYIDPLPFLLRYGEPD